MTSSDDNNPTQPAPKGVLEPRAAHDAIGFSQLQAGYNFLNVSSYGRVLSNLIVEEMQRRANPEGSQVLDVGCGCGIGRDVDFQWAVREHLGVEQGGAYWGIEPDDAIHPVEGLFDNFQHALMETAQLPENQFDVAYSSMVMEHVEKPAAFLTALERCLKPGGVYLFATPNARSFVPWMSWAMHRLRIDEVVLRLVRGKQQVEEYHYPLQFLFNSPQQVAACAEQHGFLPPKCSFIEGTGAYSYFRGPLKLLKPPLLAKRKFMQRPDRLATLIGRLEKKS
ncbi:Ubiquinone biosynthesis O-methyltransferase [Adhaeretor mobilis]|uniref:Ubiquinone biosynthesis O-methyltransferase n=2 Tax=Adhaeretor mobilis TaxID=1930276 RepID=A0A517MRM2_9BACT|nr:Ubiquinone biosynthesis O-methyltransferase [Adhaeretor mobilis]